MVGSALWLIVFAVTLVGGHPAFVALAFVALCVGVARFTYPRYRLRGEATATGAPSIDD